MLGGEVQARAREIAAAVLQWWDGRRHHSARGSDEQIREDIVRTTELGAATLGRFLVTHKLPSDEERETMAAPGKAPLHDTIGVRATASARAWSTPQPPARHQLA